MRYIPPLNRKAAITDLMGEGLRTKGMGHGDEYDKNRRKVVSYAARDGFVCRIHFMG